MHRDYILRCLGRAVFLTNRDHTSGGLFVFFLVPCSDARCAIGARRTLGCAARLDRCGPHPRSCSRAEAVASAVRTTGGGWPRCMPDEFRAEVGQLQARTLGDPAHPACVCHASSFAASSGGTPQRGAVTLYSGVWRRCCTCRASLGDRSCVSDRCKSCLDATHHAGCPWHRLRTVLAFVDPGTCFSTTWLSGWPARMRRGRRVAATSLWRHCGSAF